MYKLLEDYPNATEVVREWFMEQMIESFKDQNVPEEFKEFMRQQGIDNDKLIKVIESNPRVLFDVFDDNGLIINVIHVGNGFSWNVADAKSIKLYSSRKNAEVDAVEITFKMLDEKLNVTLNERSDSTECADEIQQS